MKLLKTFNINEFDYSPEVQVKVNKLSTNELKALEMLLHCILCNEHLTKQGMEEYVEKYCDDVKHRELYTEDAVRYEDKNFSIRNFSFWGKARGIIANMNGQELDRTENAIKEF